MNRKKLTKTIIFIGCLFLLLNSSSKKVYAQEKEQTNLKDTITQLDSDILIIKNNKNKMNFQSILDDEEKRRKAEEERIRIEQEKARILQEKLNYQRDLLNSLGGYYEDNNNENGLLDDRVLGAIQYEKNQIGKPYSWGATGDKSFDCSGLTMRAYESVGIEIGRTTYDQIYSGIKENITDIKAGDLILFNYDGSPSHVGMYIGNGLMIHAPGEGKKIQVASVNYNRICGIRRIV